MSTKARYTLLKTKSQSAEELATALSDLWVGGDPFRLDDDSSVSDICGDIGSVYPPDHYAEYPSARLYMLWTMNVRSKKKEVIAYCAVRYVSKEEDKSISGKGTATFVIDAFGVHSGRRGTGVGTALYRGIEADICGAWKDALNLLEGDFTISIQSTYDRDSYSRAVDKHSVKHIQVGKDDLPEHFVAINLTAVALELEGSCCFWCKMGFIHSDLVCTRGLASVLSPILIMWYNPYK
jgi:GNAT superfamily N-acetyltransferase